MAETLAVCCLSMLCPHDHSHYLQYPKPLTSLCLHRRRVYYICVVKGGVGVWGGIQGVWATASLSWNMDSYFDTHTVDSKQPWTNGNSGFFSHYVFYFFMVWKENTNCNFKTKKEEKKGLWDNYILGYVFRMPTCLDVSQDNYNFILMDSLLIAVYWIAL